MPRRQDNAWLCLSVYCFENYTLGRPIAMRGKQDRDKIGGDDLGFAGPETTAVSWLHPTVSNATNHGPY